MSGILDSEVALESPVLQLGLPRFGPKGRVSEKEGGRIGRWNLRLIETVMKLHVVPESLLGHAIFHIACPDYILPWFKPGIPGQL